MQEIHIAICFFLGYCSNHFYLWETSGPVFPCLTKIRISKPYLPSFIVTKKVIVFTLSSMRPKSWK